ncbi:manganese and iron superoxide dismutase, partial [Patellaria atrata CBS 101060]
RYRHIMPNLADEDEVLRNGYPGFMSSDGVQIAWSQYQSFMLEKLDRLTSGTQLENASIKTLIIKSARDPNLAPLFNAASMAHNNHFFFNCLSNKTTPTPPSSTFVSALLDSFSSMETLRDTFLGTADSMFGPGFVWLVKSYTKEEGAKFKILNTYIAGSPLSGAHYRQQPLDMNTTGPLPSSAQGAGITGPYATKVGTRLPPGGADVTPILCVNTWEHVYIRDYGVKDRMKYLENWWDRINWAAVEEGAGNIGKMPQSFRSNRR